MLIIIIYNNFKISDRKQSGLEKVSLSIVYEQSKTRMGFAQLSSI